MQVAIKKRYDYEVLDQIDCLWCKSYRGASSNVHIAKVVQLYRDLVSLTWGLYGQYKYYIMGMAIAVGMKRHIKLLLSWGDPVISPLLDEYRLASIRLRYAVSGQSNKAVTRVTFPDMPSTDALRKWYIESRAISTVINRNLPRLNETVLKLMIEKLFSKLNSLKSDIENANSESNAVSKAVTRFMWVLAEEVTEMDNRFEFIPVLTGSAAGRTRCFLNNEFDFLLVFTHTQKLEKSRLRDGLKDIFSTVISSYELRVCEDSRLIVREFAFNDSGNIHAYTLHGTDVSIPI